MKQTKRNRYILQIVAGIFVIVFGVVFLVLRPLVDDEIGSATILITSIFMLIFGPILILFGSVGLLTLRAAAKKATTLMNDGSSLAFFTYGGNGGYKHYAVILDKKGQSGKNVATNVLGAASFVFLGAGMFSSGFKSIDCFVSKDEIILNDKQENPGLKDELFTRYNADMIKYIETAIEKNYIIVDIELVDGKLITLHVPNNGDSIRDDFIRVKNTTPQTTVF